MKCAVNGCEKMTAGKSKYCYEHRKESRARFKAMLENQAQEKAEREQLYKTVWLEACEAGRQAGESHNPRPMVVQQHANQLDDNSPVVYEETISDGVCGFAWVTIRPANCKFANWLKKNELAKTDSYSGGVKIWIGTFGQSYERKLKCAKAMAEVINKYLDLRYCYASGRLD